MLGSGLNRRSFPWICQPEINALALPTKQIFVYSGLVDLVEDDDLLAAVLGHEVAHAIERHAVENVREVSLERSHADSDFSCSFTADRWAS